jgi:hypothetical protein
MGGDGDFGLQVQSHLPYAGTTPAHGHHVADGVWCFEKDFQGCDDHPPVRLVVFDCDETLTVSTFLPGDQNMTSQVGWSSAHADYIVDVNFVPPWNPDRLAQLQNMFAELANGSGTRAGDADAPSTRRVLAVLTRNSCGAVACLNLLTAAGLAEHLSAVWSMQSSHYERPNGVYKDSDGTWQIFMPPLQDHPDHKADALAAIARDPKAWFPQGCPGLEELKMEEIALVDDAGSNFESFFLRGPKVLRGCKVARYDAAYLEMGWVTDMGGIGAHQGKDFQDVIDFVNAPWKFRTSTPSHGSLTKIGSFCLDWSSKM